jgi:hypothetical protein
MTANVGLLAQPDPSVIDMFCIKREVSACGEVK